MSKSSTAVAVKDNDALDVLSPDELDLIRSQQEDEFDDDLVSIPILKIGQPLTREVEREEAEVGEFINTLSGEGLGNKVEFVVSYYQKGRFASDKESGRAFVAFGRTIPDSWKDLPFVGEEYVGTPFDEHPDAEETYKTRVNNGDIEWGSGPRISTTHNFTGLVIPSETDAEEGAEPQPVRLSLQRTNMPAVKRIMTLKRAAGRNKDFWDLKFLFGSEKKAFKKGAAYLLTVKVAGKPTSEERRAAAELAQLVAAGRVADNSADAVADAPVEPESHGGLDV